MQKIIPIFFLLLGYFSSFTQTSISDIVNVYSKVTAIENCSGKITVTNASNFQTGMYVLIIQMKGANINTANSASFGNITNINGAGQYEINEIINITGNDIYVKNALIHTYDINGKVQLIGVPIYDDVTVINDLSGQPWNGTTGGVIFLKVQNNIELEANIDASGIGFRGGITNSGTNNDCSWISNQNEYYYGLGSWRGAQKGEGVADYISGRESGRGAQANGGGGGNDHNAGGGGGANVTGGGKGGDNDEPSTFGCDGYFAGMGGKPLPNTNDRLFLGGGGGAGHSNNEVGTNGGNGGGIVVVITNTITGNSYKITANGDSPIETNGDGAGGGGGGGSILIDATTINPILTLEARGGNGGNINNNGQERCFGPGGGGSGGRIAFVNATTSSINISRGNKGVSVNSAESCDVGSENGSNGISGNIPNIPQGNTQIIAPQITNQTSGVQNTCLNGTVTLNVEAIGINLTYQWQENTGSGFHNISDNANYTGSNTPTLVISNFNLSMQNNQYQCIIISNCFDNPVSTPVPINIMPNPVSAFTFTQVDDSTYTFQNISTDANEYFWSFGDGTSSTEEHPTHVFQSTGDFVISLTSTNDCNNDQTTITVNAMTSPTANFTTSTTEGCGPLEVQFNNSSSTNVDTRFWTFEGGTPATSTAEHPTVIFNSPGIYDVTLTVTNQAGSDIFSQNDYIHVLPNPRAIFTSNIADMDVTINNISTNATDYQWDFGDGNTSSDISPVHHYDEAGYYTIVLTASSICGDSFNTQDITIGSLPTAHFDWDNNHGCTPFDIQFTNLSVGNPSQTMWLFEGGTPANSIEQNPVVTYSDEGSFDVTLVVTNGLGNDTLHFTDFITANLFPNANFSFSVSGNTVHFTNLSENGEFSHWNFGDGSPISDEENPVHTYLTDDVYQVTLSVSNSSCGASIAKAVWINTTGIDDFAKKHISIYPNPTRGLLQLAFDNHPFTGNITIFDETGRRLLQKTIWHQQETEIDLTNFPKGMYLVKVWNEEIILIGSIIRK